MPNWNSNFNATNATMNVKDMIKNAQMKGGFEPYQAEGVAKYASTVGGRRRKRTRRRKSRRSRR